LKAKALQCLAQREHSRAELRRKLLRWLDADDAPASEAQVDALLAWLIANRVLDERRFVESRVHARAGRFGNRRIENELKQHGVALDVATAAALRASELARACEVRAKRFGELPHDAAARARQMRFLVGRGFSGDVVRRALSDDD
jgi:regulatory protein